MPKHGSQPSVSSHPSQKSVSSSHSQRSALSELVQPPASTEIPRLPDDSYDVDVIGFQHVLVEPSDVIHSVAQAAMVKAMDSVDFGAAGEMITYGNQEGRDIQRRLDKSEVQVADLQNRVKVLAQTSEGYRKIRHRFLDTYRRDILRQVDRQGHSKISGGNQAAHEGDAVADAELYTSGERFDEKLLVELYGLTPNQISLLVRNGDFDSISVLNAAATWRAKGPNYIPPDVNDAFENFILELEGNLSKSLTNNTSRLSKAYVTFWELHRKHKL